LGRRHQAPPLVMEKDVRGNLQPFRGGSPAAWRRTRCLGSSGDKREPSRFRSGADYGTRIVVLRRRVLKERWGVELGVADPSSTRPSPGQSLGIRQRMSYLVPSRFGVAKLCRKTYVATNPLLIRRPRRAAWTARLRWAVESGFTTGCVRENSDPARQQAKMPKGRPALPPPGRQAGRASCGGQHWRGPIPTPCDWRGGRLLRPLCRGRPGSRGGTIAS